MLINNQVFKFLDSAINFRLLYQVDDLLILQDLNSNKFPYHFSKSKLLNLISDGEVELVDNYNLSIPEDIVLSEDSKVKRDYYWNLLKDLLEIEPLVYEKKFRSEEIRKIAEAEKISEQTLNSKMKAFWKAGKIKNSLAPNYLDCGGKGIVKDCSEVKRGRKRTISIGSGVNIDSEIRKKFEIALNKYYYTSARKSLKLTYEMMLRDYFADYTKNSIEIPTYSQFHYWFTKTRSIKKEVTTRFSQKTFLKDYRAIPSSINSLDEVNSPGYFEIDANLSDFYICSEFDRSKIIGRANIYLVIDVFSRMIVSTYVGLEVNDYSASALSILNIAADKVDLCKKFGVEIDSKQWPVEKGTLPNYLISDRAELQGGRADNITNSLGVEIRLCTAYRGDLKGVCERVHKTISELITPHMSGSIVSKHVERGDKDYRLKASLTLKEATKIVFKAIVFYNNFQVLESFQRDEDMVRNGVKPIPAEIFKWGLENRAGMLKKFDYEFIKRVLLPTDKGRMTGKGIKFKGLYFVTKEHFVDESYIKARQSTWEVDISYDPRNLEVIYHRINGEFIECKLSDRSMRYKNSLLEDLEILKTFEREEMAELEKIKTTKKIEFINEVEAIVAQSKNQVFGRSSSKKSIKGIGTNRKAEMILNRITDKSITDDDMNGEQDNEEFDYLDLIFQNQSEGLDHE